MIKIKKNNIEKEVTKGAYENLYKAMGFEVVGNKKPIEIKEAKVVEEPKEPVKDSKDDFEKKEIEDFILDEIKNNKKKGSK